MKKIQLTVEVPDDLNSIDHLELYVNQLGQKVKREIFSSLLSQIIDRHKQSELDSSACPHCKKKRSLSVGSRFSVRLTSLYPDGSVRIADTPSA